MNSLVPRRKRNSWLINSTWVMLILMSAFLWQCEKDTFEGETVGVCPEVISSDPASNATNVVTNKIITATFNVAMNPSSINGATYTIKLGDAMVPGVVTYAGKIATFTPTNPLEANKTYTGMVSRRVKDTDGNYPIENYIWSFTTGDVPVVISTDPETAASSVPLDKIITATFSTDMDPSTINGTTFLVSHGNDPIDGTVSFSEKSTTVSSTSPRANMVNKEAKLIAGIVSYSNKTATFTPTNPLADNTVYTGTITMGVKDVAGNAMADSYKWCFSTAQTQYTITLSSNPAEGGSTSGGGLFNEDDETTIVAVPVSGYSFVNWTEGGNVVSTNSNYLLTVNSNRELVANFSINTFDLDVTAINGSVTIVPNETTFDYGTAVLLTAVPNTGYSFTGWSEDATGTSNPLSILMDEDKSITANFELIPPDTYTLNVTSTLGGTTSRNPSQAGYTNGTVVQVSATPGIGYSFAGWSGDATGTSNPLSVTMNSNKNIVANFTLDDIVTYSLNVIANNGIVLKNPSQANYDEGSTVQLTATPNEGYTFTGWSGDATGSNNPLTITMNSNKEITANFELVPANTYTLNVTAVNGTVVKNPNEVNYEEGSTVQLTASPMTGYTFTGWSGDATGSANPLTVTMDSNKEITANFELMAADTYTLNVTAVNGTVVKNPNEVNYEEGSTVQLTASPMTGYTFTGWSGDATGSANPLTVTMDSNKEITANFEAIAANTYTLNITAVNGTVGKNPNEVNYNEGSTVQLNAIPNLGYAFTGWSGDATGSANPLTVTMDSNKEITANFELIPADTYTLNVIAVNGTVLKNPNEVSYEEGSTVLLTATANDGYIFTGWGGDATGSNNPLTVTMDSNKEITANFELMAASTYTLDVSAINGSVNKNPNSPTYDEDEEVELTAVPNTGYTFTSWGGDATGSDNPLTVIMNEDKEIVANFSIITFTLTVISENGDVTLNPEQIEYNFGENVELTATANSGYTFDSWSGDATGSTNPITVLMDDDKIVTANFTELPPAGPLGIDLGSAGDFAILAGSGISNTGVSTMINGDVGSFPTATINGLLDGNVNGTLYTVADPIVGLAKEDLTTAYNDAQSRSLDAISLPGQIGGLTLAPGLYVNSTTSGISGTGPNGILTLDAGGNPNAVWIFKVGSTFITDAGTSVVLAGGAQAKNIYWSVGTSATFGTNSVFYGNVLADQSITLETGATLNGRALTRIAAVTLDTNTVNKP